MTDLTTTRTPEVIAAEVRALTATVLTNVIEIGRRFAEAKAMLPHGEFGAWLEESTGYSQRTANNFMRLFEAYGDQQASLFGTSANSQTFANLPYSKALALLSVPEEEREAFAQEVDAEGISLRELKEKIKAREQEAEELRDALSRAQRYGETVDAELKDVQADLEAAQDQIQELQSRPVEVAVREPTPEEMADIIADRMHDITLMHAQEHAEDLAAIEQAQQKVKDLEAKLKDAKAAQDKVVEAAKVEGAKEAAAMVAKLKQDLAVAQSDVKLLTDKAESLERSATMAQEPVITFRACFGQWQKAHKDMLDALERAAQEPASKLKAAMRAQLENWLKEV